MITKAELSVFEAYAVEITKAYINACGNVGFRPRRSEIAEVYKTVLGCIAVRHVVELGEDEPS